METKKFYIGGKWVNPTVETTVDVVNPSTEETITSIALGGVEDVNSAVAAAKKAFETFSQTSKEDRIALLERIIQVYQTRSSDLAKTISEEMGSPMWLANVAHAPLGIGHFSSALTALKNFSNEEHNGTTSVVYEPVGVCAMITPWNWPLNQIAAKVAPALAAGCTMVLKPSEVAPLNAIIFAEILHEAGVPAGVFNLVHGDGLTVGAALSSHRDVDMVSFTGSTRAGIDVARNAAPTVKRVTQELGGKSANIILDDANFDEAVTRDVTGLFVNSGQSCNAVSRLLVPEHRVDEVIALAKAAAEKVVVGNPADEGTFVGPVASLAQFEKIQRLIQIGIDEGGTIVTGGTGRPEAFKKGYFVKPTVFANITNEMTIAREEIFGPVLTIIGYKDEEDAIRIANDTDYGLAGAVSSENLDHARKVARRIRTGMVHLNGAGLETDSPFGGYKQSGNGREFGSHGFKEFLESKSIYGDRA